MSGTHPGDTATVTMVKASEKPVEVLPLNLKRIKFVVFNDASSSLFLKYGEGVSNESFTLKLAEGERFETSFAAYRGVVTGFWEKENGFAMVTEIS